MEKFLAYLRGIFISVEFFVILAASYILIFRHEWADVVGAGLKQDTEGKRFEWLALIPIGLCVPTLDLVRKIRLPENRKKLKAWPELWRLRAVADVAVLYSLIFASLAGWCWLGSRAYELKSQCFLLIVSVVGAAVVAFSCWRAEIVLNEILDTFSGPDDDSEKKK